MSSLNPDDDQKWVPTHVQVTVLKGRGLRGKGKSGTSDVYTIIQLGKEKYSTCVVEKTTEPEWREECTFELQPGALDNGELVLTVMHRALIGLDVFLGQAVIPLDTVFTLSRGVKNEWYRLNSKTGKKEKERGDIQVTVQFSRNNLTASMYDLVMKDKGVSTFFKLKERIRGKRRCSEEDSSSAILPGGYGSLVRMRQRLPSDGGGEEYYEDDEGGEVRRSKMRTFFLRGKLRKSSDTRSSTSLGSESSESSSRGGSLSPTAGISVVVSDLSNSPSNSSNLTADNSPEHTANTSPKLSSPKCEFGDEAGEITIAVPQPKVCVNGSHSLSIQLLDSGKPAASLGLGLLKPLPLSMSLQNLSPVDTDLPRGIMGDGRRWSFDKPDEEEKAAIAAALEQSGPMLGDTEEESLGSNTTSSCITVVTDVQGKKKRTLFSHGRESTGMSSRDESEQAPDDRHRGWFGSKDSHSKPSHSQVVSPTDPHPPPSPRGCTIDPPLYHSNPFSPSQPSPPHLSPANPFFSVLHNPFYKDMLNVTPSLPPLPFLSSARPPITALFPEAKSTIQSNTEATSGNAMAEDHLSNEHSPLSKKSSNPFTSEQELEAEWDQSFDEFAAGRLQSPEDLTTGRKTQQNTPCGHPLTLSIDKETALLKTDGELTTNETIHSHPTLNFTCADTNMHVKETSTHHCFTKYLDTIPENSLEIDNKPFSESTQNTDVFNDSHCEISSQKFNSSSPDPTSSGLGSSAEEDGLSCFSSCSASDKLYASSSEETELHHCESSISAFEKPPVVVKYLKTSESEEEGTDKSEDMSLDQKTVIEDYGEEEDVLSTLEIVQSATTMRTEIEGSDTEDLNCNTDPILKQDIDASPNREHELSPTLPPVFVITSSPGRPDSPCAAEQDQLSPVPRALFNDFPNTSSISPSPDTSLMQTSDRSSFAQSLYASADSQEYQTCLTHATSGLSEANSTLCMEENSFQMANNTATDLDDFFNTSRHSNEEVKPAQQNGGLFGDLNATIFETNFTPVDNFMIQRDSHPKQEVLVGDLFSKGQSSGSFDDNFTDFVIQGSSHPKQEVIADDQSQNHLNGGEFVKFGSNFTTMDKFMIKSDPQPKQEELPGEIFFRGLNGGLFDNVNKAKFGSNFTAMDNFRLQSDLQPIKEELDEMFLSENKGGLFDNVNEAKFGSNFIAVDNLTLQSSTEPKQEAVACDMFATSLNSRLSDNVNETKFGSSFTAMDNLHLHSDLQPIKEELADDMFSKDQSKGRLFDNVNDAQSNFTAVDNFSLQSSPKPAQDAFADDMFSNGLNSGLFDGVYTVTFQSNFTTVDGIEIQSDPQPKQEVLTDDLFPNYPNGGVTNDEINFDSSFPAVEDFTIKNDPLKQDAFVDDMFSKLHNSGVFDNEAKFGSTFESNFTSNFTTSDNFMMQRAPQPKPEALTDDILTKHLKAEHATLYRSQSEGTLTPAFDDLQPSAFGSDPGNIQESSTKPQPDLLLFSPFNPCLTPQCSSSPIPLCPLPLFANAAAATSTPGSPTCPAPATMAKSQETSQEQASASQLVSPHPVKPLTTATTGEEKKTESRSVLEKLKSTINPGRSSQSTEDSDKKKSLTEGAGSYYHLTHSELVSLLVQREAELGRQKAEFERQKTLLSKREVELKKLKPQVKDLEDYIDTLLVRIMEQKPTLLQVRSKFK